MIIVESKKCLLVMIENLENRRFEAQRVGKGRVCS